MPTPARILRTMSENLDRTPRQFNERQRLRHERIVAHATHHMASEGRHNITFSNLAIGLGIPTTTLRNHFADLDALLADILTSHLTGLQRALGEIAYDDPGRAAKQRGAYLAYTRTAFGGLTSPHLLLVRDRHTLPEDLRGIIEHTRQVMGQCLAGDQGEEVLHLLDAQNLHPVQIEAVLAKLIQPAAPEPARQIQAPPPRPRAESPKTLRLPETPTAHEKPGDWIYSLAIPGTARAPPA